MWYNSRRLPSHVVPTPERICNAPPPPPTPCRVRTPLAQQMLSPAKNENLAASRVSTADTHAPHVLWRTVEHSFEVCALLEAVRELVHLLQTREHSQSWQQWKEGADIQNTVLRAYTEIDRLIRTQLPGASLQAERDLYAQLQQFVGEQLQLQPGSEAEQAVTRLCESCMPKLSCSPVLTAKPVLASPRANSPEERLPTPEAHKWALRPDQRFAGYHFDAHSIRKSRQLVRSCTQVFRDVVQDPDLKPDTVAEWFKSRISEHDSGLPAHNIQSTLDWLQCVHVCAEKCGLGSVLHHVARFAIAISIVFYGVKHPGLMPPVTDSWTGLPSKKPNELMVLHCKRVMHRLERDMSLKGSIYGHLPQSTHDAVLELCAELVPMLANVMVVDTTVSELKSRAKQLSTDPSKYDRFANLIISKLCVQLAYKARFFRPYDIGARALEGTYQEMLMVKEQAELRQGLQEPLVLHRTEIETYRQFVVGGVMELVTAMHCAGLGSKRESSFLFGRESASSALMNSRRKMIRERVAGVPFIHQCRRSGIGSNVYH